MQMPDGPFGTEYHFNIYNQRMRCSLQSALSSALHVFCRAVTGDALLRTSADLRTLEAHATAERHQQGIDEKQERSPHCLVVFSLSLNW